MSKWLKQNGNKNQAGLKKKPNNNKKSMSQASFSGRWVTMATRGEQGCCHVCDRSELTLSDIGSLWFVCSALVLSESV